MGLRALRPLIAIAAGIAAVAIWLHVYRTIEVDLLQAWGMAVKSRLFILHYVISVFGLRIFFAAVYPILLGLTVAVVAWRRLKGLRGAGRIAR